MLGGLVAAGAIPLQRAAQHVAEARPMDPEEPDKPDEFGESLADSGDALPVLGSLAAQVGLRHMIRTLVLRFTEATMPACTEPRQTVSLKPCLRGVACPGVGSGGFHWVSMLRVHECGTERT